MRDNAYLSAESDRRLGRGTDGSKLIADAGSGPPLLAGFKGAGAGASRLGPFWDALVDGTGGKNRNGREEWELTVNQPRARKVVLWANEATSVGQANDAKPFLGIRP